MSLVFKEAEVIVSWAYDTELSEANNGGETA
jgi:hypothetical protein